MIKILFNLLWISSIILANGKPTNIDKEIMNLSLNYEFDKADELLNLEFEKATSLKNHFLYLNVELLKVIQATDEAPYKRKRAVKDSLNQRLLEYAEDLVEQYEDKELSLYERFYLGSIHGVLGRLYGVSRSWMSAFSAGKEGKNIMEEIIEEDSSFTDAYLLVGMLNYYADRMGGFIEFVAGILGLSGDRNLGLKYLEKVEKEGNINNWQATMILIELYSRLEGNKFASIPLLEKIVDRFPNNKHFTNWLCYDYINMHHLKKAGRMIASDSNNFINDFVKAAYFHETGEFEKSNDLYNEILNEEDLIWPWVYENAKFTRALNYLYMGYQSEATNHAKNLNERYAQRFKELTLDVELTYDLRDFKKSILFDEPETISTLLQSSMKFKKSVLAESAFNYYVGIYYFKEGSFKDAEKYFIESKKLNFSDYGAPASQYLIHIYKNIVVAEEQVERLLDDIDELDNEGLEFFAQDLEEKYNL